MSIKKVVMNMVWYKLCVWRKIYWEI